MCVVVALAGSAHGMEEVTTLLLMPAGFDLMLRTRSGETTMHSVPALGHVVDLLFEVDTQSILTL